MLQWYRIWWSLLIDRSVENDSKVVSVMAANLPEVTMFPNQTSALAVFCPGRESGERAHTDTHRHCKKETASDLPIELRLMPKCPWPLRGLSFIRGDYIDVHIVTGHALIGLLARQLL